MKKTLKALVALALILSFQNRTTIADPSEQAEINLNRNAQTGFMLQTQLTKNIYRYESHTVTRTRSVPYDVEVPYENLETYYTTEQQCGTRAVPVCQTTNVCRQEQDDPICESTTTCHQVPGEQVCQDNNVCREVPGEQVCEDNNVCRDVPGEQVCEHHETCREVTEDPVCEHHEVCRQGPDGQQVCQDHPVCHGGGTRQECEDHPVCHTGPSTQTCENHPVCHTGPSSQTCENHPVCHSGEPQNICESHPVCRQGGTHQVCEDHEVCHNEDQNYCEDVQVAHEHYVTRYRTETQYRDEEYEDVVTVPIFVNQIAMNVQVQFPAEAILLAQETEVTHLSLDDTGTHVTIDVKSPVFAYKVASNQVKGQYATISLNLTPKYSPEDLGEKTINDIALNTKSPQPSVTFTDSGLAPRVDTQYGISVVDMNGKVLFQDQKPGVLGQDHVTLPIGIALPSNEDAKVIVTVGRHGMTLSGVVAIRKELIHTYQYDAALFVGEKLITGIDIQNEQFSLSDLAPKDASINTTYTITLTHIKRFLGANVGKNQVAQQTFNQNEFVRVGANSFRIDLTKFREIDSDTLAKFFKRNKHFTIDLTVKRTSPRINNGQEVHFDKSASIVLN